MEELTIDEIVAYWSDKCDNLLNKYSKCVESKLELANRYDELYEKYTALRDTMQTACPKAPIKL